MNAIHPRLIVNKVSVSVEENSTIEVGDFLRCDVKNNRNNSGKRKGVWQNLFEIKIPSFLAV